MAKKSIEHILAQARDAGVEVRIMERPKGAGEIVLLPGIRPRHEDEFDEYAPERDDDGTGTGE